MFERLAEDIKAIKDRDPAARGWFEIVTCYPSFHVMLFHRLAKFFWNLKWHVVGRMISQWGRWLTGIEIHPGATIGRRFFIDHGMGVVIGEYAEIGDDVTLYHGVTLGGTSPSVDSDSQRNQKRHPTLEDRVIVGSGAQIFGPITVGECARVGANAIVMKDVPPKTTVIAPLAKAVAVARAEQAEIDRFMAYGVPTDIGDEEALDPQRLKQGINLLKERLNALEDKIPGLAASAELEAGESALAPTDAESPADAESSATTESPKA